MLTIIHVTFLAAGILLGTGFFGGDAVDAQSLSEVHVQPQAIQDVQ